MYSDTLEYNYTDSLRKVYKNTTSTGKYFYAIIINYENDGSFFNLAAVSFLRNCYVYSLKSIYENTWKIIKRNPDKDLFKCFIASFLIIDNKDNYLVNDRGAYNFIRYTKCNTVNKTIYKIGEEKEKGFIVADPKGTKVFIIDYPFFTNQFISFKDFKKNVAKGINQTFGISKKKYGFVEAYKPFLELYFKENLNKLKSNQCITTKDLFKHLKLDYYNIDVLESFFKKIE
jgi:hypothetical protein